MRRLWVAAALAPLTFAASIAAVSAAHADTTVGNSSSTPLATSTAGNVTISAGGSIAPKTSTPAVTIDSTNGTGTTVNNAGSITFTGISNTAGIQANSGNTGLITSSGTITLTESTTGDKTNQGYTTGPYANGTNRFGIAVSGPFTGLADTGNGGAVTVIDNTGTITVIGENSAGIYTQGALTGGILSAGAINVTGGNALTSDVSYGILATGTIAGDVNVTGTVSATGQNAVGVALNQGDAGALTINNAITVTGYRSITDPGLLIDPKLNADQTLQGGPGVYVGGSVSGGLLVVTPVVATSTVTAVTGGSIIVYGDAPALLIGGASPMTIGQIGTTGTDVSIGGTITASGVYNNIGATGIQIGGTNNLPVAIGGTNVGGANVGGVASGGAFGTVSIANGLAVSGSVSAVGLSQTIGNGSATSIYVGNGASLGNVTVSGALSATTEVAATSSASAIALKIDQGGSVGALINSGTIAASITPIISLQGNVSVYTGGVTGTPIAVQDAAGSLTSISNTNSISAVYLNAADTIIGRGTAFDLSANTTGVSITQGTYTGAVVGGNSAIIGDILFGSGAAVLNVGAGSVTGNILYGASANNSLTIASGATVTGGLAQANGGSLALDVGGSLIMNAPTSTTLVTNAGTSTVPASTTTGAPASISLSSLHVASTGQVTFTVNPAAAASSEFVVAGNTTLDSGAKINLNLTSKVTGDATFTLIQNINGSTFASSTLATNLAGGVPFLYTPSLTTTQGLDGSLAVTLTQKTPDQLTGFSTAERSAFNPFFTAFSNDAGIESDVLSKTDERGFKQTYDQFLPDFAGGPFQTMELGQEAIYRAESDTPIKLQTDQTRGWVQEIGYLDHRDNNDSGGYNGSGFGVVGGLENAHGESAVGVTAAFLTTNVKDAAQSANGHLSASVLEGGVYWRSGGTGLNFDASLNGGWAFFGSRRMLVDSLAPDPITGAANPLIRGADSSWSGGVVAAHFGVSAPLTLGRFYARPEASIDYYGLFEGGHSESGGGTGFDLTVASRTSQEALAQADMVFGANLGEVIKWRPEVTLGWRSVVEGGPGTTTANFAGGSTFNLSPGAVDKGGFLARLGVRAGGQFADFSADAGGEYGSGTQNYDARALARFLF